MSNEPHDFGRAELLGAEAIGQPGSRRFRLFARSRRGAAALWMEREQLEALSLAIDQMLTQISGGDVLRPEALANVPVPPGAPDDFPNTPDVEFQVAQLQLGYDEDRDLILLRASPIEVEEREGGLVVREDVQPLFSALISRAQASALSAHVIALMASGRPGSRFWCPPMEQPHVCVKQLGFLPIVLILRM